MKNLLFGLIATVLFSFTGNAQEVVSGKISNGRDYLDIPSEVESNLKYDSESSEFTVISKYSELSKGTISLIMDSKDKVVAVTLPSSVSQSKMGPILNCYKDCLKAGGGGSEGSAWLCYWLCITNL